jgi:hypothetical protein
MIEAESPEAAAVHRVMPILFGAVQGQVLSAAAELGLADLLKDRAMSLEALARATETNESSLLRVLRVLVSLGIFEQTGSGEYRCTVLGELLQQDHPSTVRHYALMNNSEWILRVESHLGETLRSGRSAFPSVFGTDCYEYLQREPEDGQIFNAALTELSNQDAVALFEVYDFPRRGTVVDVGGGEGFFLGQLLQKYPDLNGILIDLPGVVPMARKRLHPFLDEGRCQVVGGDFRESLPPGGDLYVLKRMLSTCPITDMHQLLNNLRAVIPGHARLLVADPDPASLYGALFDVLMMVVVGGTLHTEDELRALLADAGFTLSQSMSTPATLRLIEAVPS